MSDQHTPGQLKVIDGTIVLFARNAGGFDIRNCPDAEANARRLVACWNACDGITDPENVVPRLLALNELVPDLEHQAATLRVQRDELLAALIRLRGKPWCNEAHEKASAAIAKVEGGAA